MQESKYKLLLSETITDNTEDNLIVTNSVNELAKIAYYLNGNYQLFCNKSLMETETDMYNAIQQYDLDFLFSIAKCDFKTPNKIIQILEKIRLINPLIHDLNLTNKSIQKEYVHKQNSNNVFISSPLNYGNIYYFKGFSDIDEIKIDNPSDHFDGIKIFEVARQACIASMSLVGFPLDGVNILSENHIHYKRFIDNSNPYFIQVYSYAKPQGGPIFSVFNIIQNGISATSGYFSGFGYKNKEVYKRLTNR